VAEYVEEFQAWNLDGLVFVAFENDEQWPTLAPLVARVPAVVALPPVFFEGDLPEARRLLDRCRRARLAVEVNSWGAWLLAKESAVRMEGGPGLAVLNALAAKFLADAGMACVTLSPEADRRQLEDLAAHCPSPCSLVVYGRPALAVTRAGLPAQSLGKVFADRRELRLVPRLENGLCVFRPVRPFDLRGTRNERIRVKHLVVDLAGSEDPVGDWYDRPDPRRRPFRFNYDRALA